MEKLKIIKAIASTVPRVPNPIHSLLLVEVFFQLIVLLRSQKRGTFGNTRRLWNVSRNKFGREHLQNSRALYLHIDAVLHQGSFFIAIDLTQDY